MRVALLVAGLATVLVIAVSSAQAPPTQRCGNVRLDRELHRSPNGDFGAFNIRARQTTCTRARRLAARYVHDPSLPAQTGPWRCAKRTIESQVLKVRCHLGDAQVSFRDVVPNG